MSAVMAARLALYLTSLETGGRLAWRRAVRTWTYSATRGDSRGHQAVERTPAGQRNRPGFSDCHLQGPAQAWGCRQGRGPRLGGFAQKEFGEVQGLLPARRVRVSDVEKPGWICSPHGAR